jgi:hypothetical protein
MISCFIELITQGAGHIQLEAMPLLALRRPKATVQCKLEEELHLRWHDSTPELLGIRHGRPAREVGFVGRANGGLAIG